MSCDMKLMTCGLICLLVCTLAGVVVISLVVAVVVTMVTVAIVMTWCCRRLNSKHCSGTLWCVRLLSGNYIILLKQLTSMNITKMAKILITLVILKGTVLGL